MKKVLPVLAAIAAVGTFMSAASAAPVTTNRASSPDLLLLPRATPAGQQTLFGHIRSLTRKRSEWKMQFDPALVLSGATAEQEAFKETGSRDVPNDSITFDETHRLLTYLVAPTAPVTIITQGLNPTTISVAEMSKIVAGKNPAHRAVFGNPKDFGFWIRVGDKYPSPVLRIDEQYQP